MPKRHICFFSGKRGGFNHLIPVIEAVRAEPDMDASIIVADMHLAGAFGHTVDEVRRYLPPDRVHEVETLMGSDSKVARVKSLGVGILGQADLLHRLAPDFLVVLGDRLEILAPVLTALQLNIPVAHLFGGDLTQGGVDEVVRHAVTKMAALHFAATEQSAERIRRMGEEPWRVHAVGSPALDLIRQGRYTPADEVRRKFSLDPDRPVVLLLQHSVTWQVDRAGAQIQATLDALDTSNRDDIQVVAVQPCSDPGYSEVVRALEAAAASRPRFQLHKNIDGPDFWGLMALAAVLVGNSSAGPLETASFHLPCINIGIRQQDRLRADNVLDVDHDAAAIAAALDTALADDAFLARVRACVSPYGDGRAAGRILDVLRDAPTDGSLIRKKMTY
ncbi:MAG: UDP-N-acetylglucosamine 2-epimerase [Desulfovibrionaceae bacterium]